MLDHPYKEIHIKNALIEIPIDYASITKTSKKWIDQVERMNFQGEIIGKEPHQYQETCR